MDREQVLLRLFGKYCREGTILYAEGSLGEGLFVVQSGAVHVGSPGGGEAPVVRGTDGILGEECFYLGGFYLCLVGSKVVFALLTGRSRTLLTGRAYVYTMRGLVVLLLSYSLALLLDGAHRLA